ncbi:hypothetical protein [Motiliproteus sp.]|uniref:oxidoreductase n=1 Tax=Motiliproteus sp. TaxID=1898955 RepID=UPI003BAB5883
MFQQWNQASVVQVRLDIKLGPVGYSHSSNGPAPDYVGIITDPVTAHPNPVTAGLTGEVQVDSRYPEKPGNLVLGANANRQALAALAEFGAVNNTHIWPQLGHAGALASPLISQPKGPSSLQLEDLRCAGMTLAEIRLLPAMYANAALLAQVVGFTGVQIHAGHGFLLSQFLSPLFNHRQDQYGGSIQLRCRLIVEIIGKVRDAVGPHFPIGIKINSSDQLDGGLTKQDALELIRILDRTSLDLIEIIGVTYFPWPKPAQTAPHLGPISPVFLSKPSG